MSLRSPIAITKPIRLRHFAIGGMVAWTTIVGISLAWNLRLQEKQVEEDARLHARTSLEQDILYRRWATNHGGVYVPVSEETPANPYLTRVEERDITTPSGRRLTLMNPSYMTRQVHELGAKEFGHKSHITSLKPLRPENEADPWEKQALRTFEQGEAEFSSLEVIDGESYMRLMLPLLTEESCLQCHSEQGYKTGQVRGGISVAVPMKPMWGIARTILVSMWVGHLVTWLLVLGGISLGVWRLRGRILKYYEAQDQIRESRNFLQTVIDEIPDPLLVIARDYQVILANRAVRDVAGGRDPVAEGLLCHQVSHHRNIPCNGKADPCPLKEVVKTKAPSIATHTHYDHEGNERIVEIVAAPIFDKQGEVVQVIELCSDVTDRVRAEREALLHQEQLIQMDKMVSLGILVSGVAHEINNPNQFIMANLSLLSEAWQGARPVLERFQNENGDFLLGDLSYMELRDQIPDLFGEVLKGCQRIKHIVRELRDYAQQRPGALVESVDLNAVVQSAVSLLNNMISKSTARFTVQYEDGLPHINGDFRRLEQVVINLVQNACQAIPDKERALSISTSHDERERSVQLRVCDEGEGIPKDALARIMDPFFTTRRDSGGTGLGLSIASSIVDEHGGTLDLASVVGEGTTATVTLPTTARRVTETKSPAGNLTEIAG